MLTIPELLKQIDQVAHARLKGLGWAHFKLALWGTKAMSAFNSSVLPQFDYESSFRQQQWYNLQAELQKLQEVLQKKQVELPAKLQETLDYYCSCKMPEDY